MNLAVSLPWWDSLDSVRKVHSDLEAASIVFFALLVAFDSAAHVLDKKSPERARVVAGIGLIFFWLAVASEIVGYKYGQRNDELSGEQISSLETKASDAAGKAAKAVTDSNAALSNSREALTAQKELDQLKAPRALNNPKGLVGKLRKYEGIEYNINVFPDDESIQLAKALDSALNASGWKRKQVLAPGAPTANTFGDGPNDQTNLCIERGIRVHMGGGVSPESIVATSKRNKKGLAENLQIGIAFCSILLPHVDPPDAKNVDREVEIERGKPLDEEMRICVGQKPNTFTPRKAQSGAKPMNR